MPNPFSSASLVPNWTKATEILKGDVSGHEFHGNQYVSAGNQVAESQKLNDYVNNTAIGLIDHNAVAEQHRTIARALEETAKPLEGEKGQLGRIRDAYVKAAEAHRFAAGRHIAALTGFSHLGAADATGKAHDASLKADELNYAN